ncbi:DUF6807 domain-containing protein [Chitinophaga lutea]
MSFQRYVLAGLLTTAAFTTQAQSLARIAVEAGAFDRHRTAVQTELKGPLLFPIYPHVLYLVDGKRRTAVPYTLHANRITWLLPDNVKAGRVVYYEIGTVNTATPLKSSEMMALEDKDGALTILRDGKPVLRYNYAVVSPPAGADSSFKRSGFIHPAWSPSGQVLTNIHPKDHYHHFGIWNPWTDATFKGQAVDFWNLKKRTGTVRFKEFAGKTEGPVQAGFSAMQEHVVFRPDGREEVALLEKWNVSAYPTGRGPMVWDFTSLLSCATDSPLVLNQYRYGGGFALRGNAAWNAANSAVLTSEDKTRKDADSSRARWIKVAGDAGSGKAGMLILSAPDNFGAPQPVRVWPEKDQQGQVFLLFSPTKSTSWTLRPGQWYKQSYRVVTFDGDLTPAQAEAYWNDFAYPPAVTLQLTE